MERWRLPVEDTPLEDCTESVLRHWDCLPDLDQSEVSIQLWAPPITAHLACRFSLIDAYFTVSLLAH